MVPVCGTLSDPHLNSTVEPRQKLGSVNVHSVALYASIGQSRFVIEGEREGTVIHCMSLVVVGYPRIEHTPAAVFTLKPSEHIGLGAAFPICGYLATTYPVLKLVTPASPFRWEKLPSSS